MPWKLTYDAELGIVCCNYSGHVTADDFKKAAQETIALAIQQKTNLLLIDDFKLESAVSTLEIYNMPKIYNEIQGNRKSRIALILPPSGKIREDVKFYETVCLNNGWKVRAFDKRSQATQWLLNPNQPR